MTAEERHPADGWLVVGFDDADAFDAWLERHQSDVPGLWVKIAKKGAAVTSIRYPDAVEVALCFGWIDSKGRGYDETYHLVRFQPRKPRSNWSASNIERVGRLIAAGRMRPEGLAHVEAAKADGRWA